MGHCWQQLVQMAAAKFDFFGFDNRNNAYRHNKSDKLNNRNKLTLNTAPLNLDLDAHNPSCKCILLTVVKLTLNSS